MVIFCVFGNEERIHYSDGFDIARMLSANYIDACAVIRKTIFESMATYDTEMLYGFEDWEFWLNILF
jgi:hypothetical protein